MRQLRLVVTLAALALLLTVTATAAAAAETAGTPRAQGPDFVEPAPTPPPPAPGTSPAPPAPGTTPQTPPPATGTTTGAPPAAATTAAPPPPPPPPPPPAQTEPSEPSWFRQHMFVGGNVGFGFGDVDYIDIEPLLGVRLTSRLSTGVSLIYRQTTADYYGNDQTVTDYGGSVFGRVRLIGGFFVEGDYEYLSYEYYTSANNSERSNASSWLAGPGLAMGGKVQFYASALYNFSYDSHDQFGPYDSNWVYRVGVGFSF